MSLIHDATYSSIKAIGSARPMLSRDADSMFWMARYVERAEHSARLLRVMLMLLTDIGDMTQEIEHRMWNTILSAMRAGDAPEGKGSLESRVISFMTFDQKNPSSIVSCIAKARENARAIRESISSEMWECLNTLYWRVTGDDSQARYDDSPDAFLFQIMNGSMLFQGVTDGTMAHDQRWYFVHTAKHLERLDVTARVLQGRFEVLARMGAELDQPIRNIHLMGVLRSCCSLEAYRRLHLADLDAVRVAEFLILQKDFPRSIRFCVNQLHHAVTGVRVSNGQQAPSAPERIVGRLGAHLEYASTDEMLQEGLTVYLAKIQETANQASVALQQAYFIY
ncbi:MAG: alpha-E domain-containing protein [Burkholderiales bacterium]|nr:alpha-E domain-containing protein [Phycisphaerae bacterium]